tara:strand:- start:5699 stop:6673 length:975 start_codon:yes stop_codon:yes gene_type:complete
MSDTDSDLEQQTAMEQVMKDVFYQSYDNFIQNFALNLPYIWNDPSARELDHTSNPNYNKNEHSAIVIGRGPTVKKKKQLELLAESDYQGNIVCCDGKLIEALNAGVTPDKFPNYFVVTIDPYPQVLAHYDDVIVDKFGSKIKGVFTTVTDPSVQERARKAGIKIHWFHSLFDYNEGKKSFNQISALMVRAKNHTNGLPAIQTGGNVGTSSWFVSWKILNCSTVCLIGINHGYGEDDSWEDHIKLSNIDKKSKNFQKWFKRAYNPDFDCYFIQDPIFQFYSLELKEFISRSPDWVTTINATEAGAIFGEKIKSMKFEQFLKEFHM